MESSIYHYSLSVALPLMLFFGFYFLFARTPDKAIFYNYSKSRKIMGIAMLLLSANYSVHFFTSIRFHNGNAAILMNLSTYYICYWLFSSALTTLLDRFYITRRRWLTHIFLWLLFSLCSGIVLFVIPQGTIQKIALFAMAAWLVSYGFILARRLHIAYHRAIRLFNDTHSDDIGAYIRWMSVFTYWALIFGIGCGLLTFLPDEYIYIWIISSIPFYIYIFHCYQNYLLFYEQIEHALETNDEPEPDIEKTDSIVSDRTDETSSEQDTPRYHEQISKNLESWIETETYTQPGLTINDMAKMIGTNRTYLSAYIKEKYKLSFRDWITSLRIEYAKRMLKGNPDISIQNVSEASGFLSLSHFIKTFTEKEGNTPAKWRKEQSE